MRKMEAWLDGPYALSQSHLTQPSVKNDSKLYNALAWRWIVLLILYIYEKLVTTFFTLVGSLDWDLFVIEKADLTS